MALDENSLRLEDGPTTPLPESRLLSFYDRLRERVAAPIAAAGGRHGAATANALLLVPDVFILLVRLTLDREVPVQSRRLVGGALLYFLAPLDLLPEVFVGPAGYIDDLVLACIVVSRAMGPDLEAYATGHWSGSEELRRVLAQVTGAAESLLGAGLTARLKALLARRGIPL